VSAIASTADLLEAILMLPEPYRTSYRLAWLRLRELNRALGGNLPVVTIPVVTITRQARQHSIQRKWAQDAMRQFDTGAKAAASLGIDRVTLYRWLKQEGVVA
jgi:transcriptional regulator of acetoin/glycerol metabolism